MTYLGTASDERGTMAAPAEALEFEFMWTRTDAVDVNALFSRSRRRMAAVIFGALSIAPLASWLVSSDPYWLAAFGAVAVVSILELTRGWVWLTVRMNEGALRVGTRLKITLNADGISVVTAGVSAAYGWQAVTSVVEDGNAIVLLQGKAPLLLMSKRILALSGSGEDFKHFVRTAAPGVAWRGDR